MRTWQASILALALLGPTTPVAAAEPSRPDRSVVPTAQSVRLVLDPAADSYRGAVKIDLVARSSTDAIVLNASNLTLGRIQLRAKNRDYKVTADPERDGRVRLRVSPALEPGSCTLAIDFSARFGAAGRGLYRMTVDERPYLFSQFQTEAARTAFPCWDEPGFKIPWQITVIVPKDQAAFSNAPVERETPFGEQKTIVFQQTPPLPSYLVAIAAGPLETAEIAGLSIPARVVTCAGRAVKAGEAARMVPPLLRSLEAWFGSAYPYGKLDVLAVPRFAYGAMENPGLVAVDDGLLLMEGSEVTPARRRELASVMGHELAHMWFGNVVTMRSWDDLWLSEAFASWVGDKACDLVYPDLQIGMGDLAPLEEAMALDGSARTRSMRSRLGRPALDATADPFTFTKGRALLAMLEQWLAPGVFQSGVMRFLQEHAGKSVGATELWQALGEASGRDVAAVVASHLDRAGVPLVSCEVYESGRVVLRQRRFWNDGRVGGKEARWQVPVALRFWDGASLQSMTVLLSDSVQTFMLPATTRWAIPGADARGYYRATAPPTVLRYLAGSSSQVFTLRERIGFLRNLEALLDAGLLRGDEYLALLSGFARDPAPEATSALLDALEHVHGAFGAAAGPDVFASYVRASLEPVLDRIGLDPRASEPTSAAELRPRLIRWMVAARSARVLRHQAAVAERWLETPEAVEPGLAREALRAFAAQGDTAQFSELRGRFEETENAGARGLLLEALASFPTRSLVRRALDYAARGPLRPAELLVIPGVVADRIGFEDELLLWIAGNYEDVTRRMPGRLGLEVPALLNACSPKLRQASDAFFDDPRHRIAGVEAVLARLVEEDRRCIQLRQREGEAVAAYLQRIPVESTAGR